MGSLEFIIQGEAKPSGPKPEPVPILQGSLSQRKKQSGIKTLFSRHSGSYPTSAEPEKPAWLINRRRNEGSCHLYRLPAELLLSIRDYAADVPTRRTLRQSCFLFLRLSATHDRLNDRGKGIDEWQMRMRPVWPIYDAKREMQHDWRRLPRPSAPGGYHSQFCDDCRALRDSGQLAQTLTRLAAPMWCNGCGVDHPQLLFSATQRSAPSHLRVCIGRQGHMRLCVHKTMSWDELEAATSQREEWERHKAKTVIVQQLCTQRSHQPKAGSGKGSSHQLPNIQVRPDGAVAVSWMSPAFDLADEPITRKHLHDYLSADSTLLGHALCPHVRLTDLLIPFEPGQCACFMDAHVDGEENDGKYHQHANISPCCRCRAKEDPSLRGNFLPEEPQFFAAMSDHFHAAHEFKCCQCDTLYSWVRDKGSSRVYLRMGRHVATRHGPTSPAWLRSLEPLSWGKDTDPDVRGVVWCPNASYRTSALWTWLVRL